VSEDDPISDAIAAAVRRERLRRGLGVRELADASGVSRAMIGKIERRETKPTAALLARLAPTLGMTLSDLVAAAEDGDAGRLSRHSEQAVWVDPATGYSRRAVSPAAGRPLQLIEVELPAHTEVPMARESYLLIHQQIWVLDGTLTFQEGAEVHELAAGDCLQLGPPADCVFANRGDVACRYLVALTSRSR
jgi:transcriptional regulator with XRE-family HTH domain